MTEHRHESGFKDRTRLAEAREQLLAAVELHGRQARISVPDADGRTVAEELTAPNPVPGYDRAAVDGFAVRAEDSFGASDRSPAILEEEPRGGDIPSQLSPGRAARVHTGSDMPEGANAVVMIEQIETISSEVEVFDAVAEGENVGEAGEDVTAGQTLYERGHRLRPSDLGLLKSTGIRSVPVFEQPTVGVIPTGEELVQSNPAPGEIIETNGLTVSQLVKRWGGTATYRDVVTDKKSALRAAIERDQTKDLIVTTGGSSVGERDLLPEVVSEIGEILVHNVALKPGHPVCLGQVGETPVISLPGYPVACIVNAFQFLRPALKRAGGMPLDPHPTSEATLARKISSDPGERTFVRVQLDETDDGLRATPTRASGSGVLSSVALADGWVVVPESREGYGTDEAVTVEIWEPSQ